MTAGAGAGSGTGISPTPFYPFTLTLTQSGDQVAGTVRETRASGDLVYSVAGTVRADGHLVLEAVTDKAGQPLRVFNWNSTSNPSGTTMLGSFTKIEPYRTGFGDSYTITTQHEFATLSHTP